MRAENLTLPDRTQDAGLSCTVGKVKVFERLVLLAR